MSTTYDCSFDSTDKIKEDNYSINLGLECVNFWWWTANVSCPHVYMNNSLSLIAAMHHLI